MLVIEIPQYRTLRLSALVLDYNGTIAGDGSVIPACVPLLRALSEQLEIYVLTADTHGTAAEELKKAGVPAALKTFPSGGAAAEKRAIVQELCAEQVCAIGNGRNDIQMCEAAGLSICVCEVEGCCGRLMSSADVVCRSIQDALMLLLRPERLRATLRG